MLVFYLYTPFRLRSGKTALSHSVLRANGLYISKKFEETTSNPLSLVLSVFDDVCSLISDKNTVEENHSIYQALVIEFGSNFDLLVRTVPNVVRLSNEPMIPNAIDGNEINYFSLCNIIQRFMRVVASQSSPAVMIVFDDLQWADSISLGLIHTVLSGVDMVCQKLSDLIKT